MDDILNYLQKINKRYQTGISREHSYRGDLQNLLESLLPDILVTNEPARVDCGAPDYILTRKNIPVGYIEAKDIGADLNNKIYQEQFDRYRKSLPNLIITDYLDFHLYRDGIYATSISIGNIQKNRIVQQPENFGQFQDLITDFSTYHEPTIKSAVKLSKMMAGKARLLATVIENALTQDLEIENKVYEAANITIREQLAAFQNVLIHDITPKDFADIYAQTIAYGMFAARLNDPTLSDFSRQEAAELIPKSNPFLRKLFQYIAGYDLDDRIKWIVDALADIFRATDVADLLKDFGKATQQNDPMIHFYETFLAEYDPKLRKSRGVFYTPEPVVNFIVRAVDYILKSDFNLPQGLADTSKTTIEVNTQTADKRSKTNYKRETREVHKVQILDPAAGTGTFLAEIVNQIYFTNFKGQEGIWSQYVDNHLIPRLHGFEILMASYAVAHLKLDLLLAETGYNPTKSQRHKIYLTNSLEEHHPDTGTLFAGWLSSEANEANHVKRDTPVMVIIGNPPYSGISSNMGEWIVNLIEDYKYVEGEHFGERKHWLHDDYVKFIRFGQHFIDKNGEGILAFINNHSFLDNPTFRGMRWNLLHSFDKIYILDLHGNTLKKEVCPDGSPDKNVFDIQAGVSINLMVKTVTKRANGLAKVFHADLWGERQLKYETLRANSLDSIVFKEVKYKKPYYFFVPKNEKGEEQYKQGFKVTELFSVNVTGVLTARDKLVIDFSKNDLQKRIAHFSELSNTDNEIRTEFFGNRQSGKYLPGDTRGWKLNEARRKIQNTNHSEKIERYNYRPFDIRFIYYDSDMVDWGREDVMKHFIIGDNLGLMICRQSAIDKWEHVGITNLIADDSRVSNRSRERGYILPLYLYPNDNDQQTIERKQPRTPNLNKKIVNTIANTLCLTFTPEKEESKDTFAPIDLLDYIYAVLHSPGYRKKYKEFLKIDFPRLPYPNNKKTFWQMVELGSELRQIHLLDSPKTDQFITSYPNDGDNTVIRKIVSRDYEITDTKNQTGRVWINDIQYFDNVPQIAWEFYIGGYQPAQKWLKDRKGRTLSFEEILHYQKIIVALVETDRLMKEIDSVEIE